MRKLILATNAVTTLAGSEQGVKDGVGSSAKFYHPRGVSLSANAAFAVIGGRCEFPIDIVKPVMYIY